MTNVGERTTNEVPQNLQALLNSAFDVVDNRSDAEELSEFASILYERAYQQRLKDRTPEDNRREHELVVLLNTIRICWRSGHERLSGRPFNRQELRVGIATSLLHDLRFIPRITEDMIKTVEDRGDTVEAARLRAMKADQRRQHMLGGAEDALRTLRSGPMLLTEAEIEQCIGYIGLHDIWKLGWPYPASSDWLAVCCVEGDALWPLHPQFGPLADLERKKKTDPTWDELRAQAVSNLDTQLRAYRKNFASSADHFRDDETILRTSEGKRILEELKNYWKI